MGGNQFNLNCTELNISQVVLLSYSRSVSAMIFFILTVVILLLLIFYKAYNNSLERFFIYLTVVTIIQLGCIGMNIELQYDIKDGGVFCQWLAFFDQWCAIMMYLFALCISILLVCTIYSQLHSKDLFSSFRNPKKAKMCMEIMIVSLIGFCPLMVLWIPFYHNTYGSFNIACWMRIVDENCTVLEFGLIDQIVFGFGAFQMISIAIIFIFISLAVQFCRYAYHYRLTRRHHLKTLCQTLFFMSFMVISALIETVGLLISVYGIVTGNGLPLWFLVVYNGAIPFSQFVVPLGFLAYLYSNKKFQRRNIKKAIANWKMSLKTRNCLCYMNKTSNTENFRYHQFPQAVDQATAPPSTRISLPSESYFKVEYTGGFTSISRPVISSVKDTDYGSIADAP